MTKNTYRAILLSLLLSSCATSGSVPVTNESPLVREPADVIVANPIPYVSYYEDYYPRYYHHYYNGGYYNSGYYGRFHHHYRGF